MNKNVQIDKQETRLLKNKIKSIFTLAGFEYIDTEYHQMKFGPREVEIDAIFFYENILLLCEITATNSKHIKDHLRRKIEAFDNIKDNIDAFFIEIKNICIKKELLERYQPSNYKIFYLYFPLREIDFTLDDFKRFNSVKFVEPQSLEYLYRMSQYIKKSVKYEVFRFLNITDEDIGNETTSTDQKKIKATIISPDEMTGQKNGVRVVSFMMSAEILIKNSYVLRKDNWEDSINLYQRLIQKEKIKSIRKFLVNKKESFYNNIIVALPQEVRFEDNEGNPKPVHDIKTCDSYSMIIPDRMNSICIIDGQHRVYAHYEGRENEEDEKVISELRKKLHLLVTGLVFPPEMSKADIMKIQSEIFMEINSKATPVPPDVILHIQQFKDPLSDVGLARAIIEKLNKEEIFLRKFDMSSLDQGKIKIASIVKFALRYLVGIDSKDKKNLFFYWNGDKEALLELNDIALESYQNFCVKHLAEYFGAIKKNFKAEWNDENSKLLSVISINGFIIAYTRFLDIRNIPDFNFLDKHLKKLKMDFSKEKFPYTSSQYRKFSDVILNEALLYDIDNQNI